MNLNSSVDAETNMLSCIMYYIGPMKNKSEKIPLVVL